MTKLTLGLATGLIALMSLACAQKTDTEGKTDKPDASTGELAQETTVDYRTIPFQTITGESTNLAAYDGQVLLLVNVASKCGYTPQYSDLEKLYGSFKDSGLVVIGFPANNFGAQEPGSDEEIMAFCKSTFSVSFPMMSKVSVLGEDKHPLFVELTEHSSLNGDIPWNFSKMAICPSWKSKNPKRNTSSSNLQISMPMTTRPFSA